MDIDDLREARVTGRSTPPDAGDFSEGDAIEIMRRELMEVIAMNDALLARAEAAEASREALADRLVFEMEQRETLAARAEAAERERDDANIEVALEQANARAAWGRAEAAEAEATDDRNSLELICAKLARAEAANAVLSARVADLEALMALGVDVPPPDAAEATEVQP